ncbi:hypothetical protein KSS93_16915 [Pseudomonas xanthosomatis]|uniref:hypothetical protein n=1 Tax=Pseudomonas xanthosomatis TaxID=2842356 RepID=UPI001C3E0FC4|nr:hypothetical protein [Pseudomonas xanthosomatis]QXH44566.1 hypothetical protein KSS93_16915 [Pseudomonas xanthosomatis]
MKTLSIALALLAASTVTSAFAEGGAERLKERSEQWAQQREQAQKREALVQEKAGAQRQAEKPAS